MSITPRIRKATRADADAIMDINRRAWAGYTTHELLERRHGVLNGRPWHEQMADAVEGHLRSKDVTTFVAEHEGRVVGHAAAQINGKGPSDAGTVSYNAVDPDYRRQGVGTALIEHVVRFLKEQRGNGSHVHDSLHNLMLQRDLFDAYVSGSLFGCCLFWTPEPGADAQGCLLSGESWDPSSTETDLGKLAILWGVYVRPEHRGKQGG